MNDTMEETGVNYITLDMVRSYDLEYDEDGMLTDANDSHGILDSDAAKLVKENTWLNSDAEQTVALAKEKGFGVTFEELEEVLNEIRMSRKQNVAELHLEEMDKVACGTFWTGEYSSDGYEFGCALSYYDYEDQLEKNEWCNKMYYCEGSHHSHKELGNRPK